MEFALEPFKKYADFTGRSRRREYWSFQLILVLGYVVLTSLIAVESLFWILLLIFGLGITVPSLAVTVRRLHDIGKSGWWLLIGVLPFAGLVLFIFTLMPGTAGTNQYGPDPKGSSIVGDEVFDYAA